MKKFYKNVGYGYICFAYSKNEWIAKAIAWFMRSQWSHSFITIPPVIDNEMAMEAAGSGTQTILFDKGYRNNKNQKYEIYQVNYSKDKINKSIDSCLKKLEMPYGYLEYPWFIWRFICKSFGKDISGQNNWSTKDEVCSGLVESFLSRLPCYNLFAKFGKNSICPQDIYEIVKANPHIFRLIEYKN